MAKTAKTKECPDCDGTGEVDAEVNPDRRSRLVDCARCDGDGFLSEGDLAAERLREAAPEMFEALKEFEDALKDHRLIASTPGAAEGMRRMCSLMNAAIAKAEGKQ